MAQIIRGWHPWRHIRDRHSRISVSCHHPLPRDLRAAWTLDGIYIDRNLGQAARRCALTHEIVHLERGPVPRNPILAAVEERIVSDIAARRLIPLAALTDALHWVDLADRTALAEELWVDELTLRTRLHGLTTDERTSVNATLIEHRPWNTDI
ncbi:hypothetical protein [Nocardia cyriacigeorgica]|uniref:ImmA/IrrE family metallo-endopeptidase n=1 Tax=Nocardia cyriacigeorgica TaxID=135487 RepID=A0A5R8NEB4_9NOCA|nr:hypothetical protein [Nocardia cyriacigeorgica]TLF72877.1 hypothetical protein FEK34_28040 [Nocardia cyriacigeorgica]